MNVVDLFSLTDNVAVVTGSSRGIGLAIAKGFVEAGAKVYGASRNSSTLSTYKNYIHFELDVTNENASSEFINQVFEQEGHIDTLVNSAGISIPYSKSKNLSSNYKETFDVNIFAPFKISYLVAEIMKKNSSGSIINVTSIGAHLAFPSNPAYISSKSALSGLTRSLSYDFAPYGIRANNLVPGYFHTKMTDDSYKDPLLFKERSSRNLMSRWGETNELVGPAIFLASNASSYITGQDLIVDGGWTVKGL